VFSHPWIAPSLVGALSLSAGAAFGVLLRRGEPQAPLRDAPGTDLILLAGLAFLAGAVWGSLVRGVGDEVIRHLLGNLGLAAIALGAMLLVTFRVTRGDALGGRLRNAPRGCLLGTLAALTLMAPSLLIHWLTLRYLLEPKSIEEVLQPTQKLLMDLDAGRLVLMTALLTIAVPFYEETVFRGLVQGGLERLLGRHLSPRRSTIGAIVIASVSFTAVHPPQTWVPIAVLSLALGALYAATRNLYAAVVAHGVHNLMSILLLRYPEILPI
jgi:membrane protease YdiL (CAAX protease family)